MKYILGLIACCSIFLSGCSSNEGDKQINELQQDILALQDEIRILSNQMAALDIQGVSYSDPEFKSKINSFKLKREQQSQKISMLTNEFQTMLNMEYIVCGDFEDLDCFFDNWDIRKEDDAVVQLTTNCSYNETTSLYLSAPFDPTVYNLPGLEIEGYCNGIETATIYKIRFWARYSGTTDKSNGPLIHMVAIQDGEWLDYIYEGAGHLPQENIDKDWKLYSFQIATKTSSPLEILLGTSMEYVCIDDIHIVKK